MVEAGDQDTADVVVVEGAAETEEKGSWSAGEQRRGWGWNGRDCKRDHRATAVGRSVGQLETSGPISR